jgi:hypothetical protein
MSRRRLVLVACAVALAAAAQAAELPVVASGFTAGPASRVDLTNTSMQPVTSWTLVVTSKEGEGSTRRAVETIDAYLSEVTREFVGASERVDRLMPGETRRFMLDAVPSGATVEVTAAILDDGTAVGDEETIVSVFEHRAKERDALREVVDAFNAVLPTMRGTAALEALKQRFAAVNSNQETPAHRSAREAVDAYLQRTTAANVDAIDQLVRKYADVVRREYELAEKHSRRKK